MLEIVPQSVGVDISKDSLDVHLHPTGRRRRFTNDPKGCAALVAWLDGVVITRIAFEPTGAYHHTFERRLALAGLPLVKVNPRRARRFAEAIGATPRPTGSTPPSSPASPPSSSHRCGPPSARPSTR